MQLKHNFNHPCSGFLNQSLYFTFPVQQCPRSEGLFSLHLQASSWFENQHLQEPTLSYLDSIIMMYSYGNIKAHSNSAGCKFSPRVVCISPLNSLRLNRSKKLDFPDPASPAKTRRYTGARSVSSKSSSVCYREQNLQSQCFNLFFLPVLQCRHLQDKINHFIANKIVYSLPELQNE